MAPILSPDPIPLDVISALEVDAADVDELVVGATVELIKSLDTS